MLIEFRFKNFRSFRDETVLSMVASKDKSLPDNIMSVPEFGNRNILRSSVIYGANAAGKSNIIAAASFVDSFINTSMDRKIGTPIEVSSFLFTAEKNDDPTEFEIVFLDESNVRYQYGFHLTRELVVREWLVAYPKGLPQIWFERRQVGDLDESPNWFFGRNLRGKNSQMAELTRSDVLFLSNAAKLNHRQLRRVLNWFSLSLRTLDAGEPFSILSSYSAKRAKEDEIVRTDIQNLLDLADLGISGFDIREETITESDLPEDMPKALRNELVNMKHWDVYMKHLIENKLEIYLPIREESSGTQRYFALGGPLSEVLRNGWTLFVDELDSSMHPLLVRYIVSLFHNPEVNRKGAQIIFNTHDITLMDCCNFRRDQIWFVEKDRQNRSHLYPLLDFSPRKNEALAKGYMMGRYGAIPFLSDINWEDNSDDEA